MRTKRAIYNFLTDFFPLILMTVIGLFRLKLFTLILGEELNGLSQTYANIMGYLMIMDGGLGSALIYRLFKPLADNDTKKISSLAAGAKRIFRIVSWLILGVGILASFFVFNFIKLEDSSLLTSGYIQMTFVLYLMSAVIPYFVIVYSSMFEAGQRKYVTNMVNQPVMIIKSIIEIIFILNGLGFVAILVLMIVSNLTAALIIYILARKAFKEVDFNQEEKNYEMMGDVKHLLVHKVGSLVAYNIDIVLVSSMIGVKEVSTYAAYNFITSNLMTMIGKITYSVTAGIGDLLARDRARAFSVFNEFNALSFFIASIICVPLVLVFNPFIQIWMEGAISTSWTLAILFVLQLLYYLIRMPLIAYTNAAGLFKETRICPIIESVVNLTLSLILIQVIGIPGILIGTFIAYLVSDYFIKPIIIYRKVFNEKVLPYYLRNSFYLIVMVISTYGGYLLIPYLPFTGYITWFLSSLLIFVINGILTLIIYIVFKQAPFMKRVKEILIRKGWLKA